eukprot:scaffold6.g2776.t1
MGKEKGRAATSAAKAAELLHRQGGGAASSGFRGFSGSTPVGGGATPPFAFGAKYVEQVAKAVPKAAGAAAGAGEAAAAPRAALLPPDLDGELSQQLQKLSKRDATTKLKALQARGSQMPPAARRLPQALRALAATKPAEELVRALPPWAYLYSRLAMDPSRGVRAEASAAQAALAAGAGRRLAPSLRALLPCWWLASHDGAPDVAAAARAGLAAAFPSEAKRLDALLYCRAEVLQVLFDNLASTPQTLGDAKKEPPEELAERHERVLAASCAALAALLALAGAAAGGVGVGVGEGGGASAAAEQARELLEGVSRQLEQPAFYKAVLQSKAAAVRRAAYGLVATACGLAPPALPAGAAAAAAPAVLGAVGECEGANHAAMWDMVLAFAGAHPSAWAAVDLRKAFLPRLWALLRHGCYGSGPASYPAVLPLVAALPPQALGPGPGLLVSLLTSVWAGLPESGGPAGHRAAAACFQDCLLYALLRADQLAANRGGGGGGAACAVADAPASAPEAEGGAEYGRQLLEAVLPATLLPAATSAGAPPAAPAAAAGILAAAVRRLAQPGGGGGQAQQLDALLQVVGAHLSAAVQSALEAAAPRQDEQQQGGEAAQEQRGGEAAQQAEAEGAAAAGPAPQPASLERVAALVGALADAAPGEAARAAVGAAVAQPLVAALLPEVRAGGAPPAAASLLAVLVKAFPQHSAGAPAAAAVGGEGGEAAAAAGDEQFAALRLQQSASFTVDSLARQLGEGQAAQEPAALDAACDLLLVCLAQVRDPSSKLGEVVQLLLDNQQHASAVALVRRAVGGAGSAAALDAGRHSRALDAAAAALAACPGQNPQLLALLLAGDGRRGLLSPPACAAVLRQLRAQLEPAGADQAAAAAAAGAARIAALQVATSCGLSPALVAADPSGDVVRAQLELLAVAFRLLAAAAVGQASDGEGGREQAGGEDEQALAASVWEQARGIGSLLQGATEAEQQALLAALHAAVQHGVATLQSQLDEALVHSDAVAHDTDAHGEVAATVLGAARQLAGAARLALAAASASDTCHQRLLCALVFQPGPAAEAAGGSSSSMWPEYGTSAAAFLVCLGQSVGFGSLLDCADGGSGSAGGGGGGPHRGGATVAVRLLAALLQADAPALDAAAQTLLEHVAAEAALLTAVLPAALQAAVEEEEGVEPGATLALCRLVEAAVGGEAGDGGEAAAAAAPEAAARFFHQHIAVAFSGLPQEQQLQPGRLLLLTALLAVAAPAFRHDSVLLAASGLPQLSAWLCARSAAAEPVALVVPAPACGPADGNSAGEEEELEDAGAEAAAGADADGAGEALPLLLLRAAVACFPCATTADAVAAAGVRGGGADLARGDAAWYLLPDGSWAAAAVVAVDQSVQPPSYGIELVQQEGSSSGGGAYRETEAHRLRLRRPSAPPPPPARAPAARVPAPAPESEAGERKAMAALLHHQARGLRGALHSRREPTAAGQAEVGSLAHAAVVYCRQQLTAQHWSAALEQSNAALALCTARLAAAVRSVVAAVARAAAAVGGPTLASPPLALQFWRRLQQKGVLARSAKAQAELAPAVSALEGALAEAERQLLPLLLPALQTHTRAAAAAQAGTPGLRASNWQAAEAAACGELLQLFLSLGSLAAVAGAVGERLAAPLGAWLRGAAAGAGGGGGGAAAHEVLWPLLGQHAAVIVREADRPFLLEAVDRANAEVEATGEEENAEATQSARRKRRRRRLPLPVVPLGRLLRSQRAAELVGVCWSVDCLGCLLGLALGDAAPAALAAPAFAALLLHPELTGALSAAAGVDEEELERQQEAAAAAGGGGAAASAADVAASLEQVGVRPELAGVVSSAVGSGGGGTSGGGTSGGGGGPGAHPRFLEGWALLLAHLLGAAPDSHGRRLLSQGLKDAPDLVPSLLDATLELLPLAVAGGGRRDSAGGAGGSTPSRGGAAGEAPGPGASPGGGAAAAAGPDAADDPAAAFASSLAALDLPLHHPEEGAAHTADARDTEQAEARTHAQTAQLAALLYWAVLQALPASARLWFGGLSNRGAAAAVERYTSARVTPALLAAELAAVAALAARLGKWDKFTVKGSASMREVAAGELMEVEEGHMLELVVRLPASMPLRPPEVECRRRVGVTEARLRKWLLSVSALLRNQNGSVAQAIGLWKRNVDKEFEGQEECLICYSVIQPTSGQLPRLACRTCRKRFHGGCLFKWFKSSGKSNCPHCQSPW